MIKKARLNVTIKYLCPSILFPVEFIALRYPKYFNYAFCRRNGKIVGSHSFASNATMLDCARISLLSTDGK